MRPKQNKNARTQSTKPKHAASQYVIERIQTGVRMEKRLLKVLKALAEYHDLSLGDLLEGIVLHAFDGKLPFDEASRKTIAEFKRIYHLNLDSKASHKLQEGTDAPEKGAPSKD
jgi:predicted DNA-binding ribbon-helix-helix protein